MRSNGLPAGSLGGCLALLAACSGSPTLAGGDGGTPDDGGADGAIGDVPPESWLPDVEPDAWSPDVEPESWSPDFLSDGWSTETDPDGWTPPLEDAGDTGWGDAVEPWAPPFVPPVGYWSCHCGPFDVWSDPTGVYLLFGWTDVTVSGDPFGSFGCGSGAGHLGLWRNQGAGWSEFFRQDERYGPGGIENRVPPVAFVGGRIDAYLLGWEESGTPIQGFREGRVEPLWPGLDEVGRDVFVVNGSLAYALWEERVVHWNGSTWSPLPVDVPFATSQMRIWADEDDLFLAGPSATLVSLEVGGWRVHDPGLLTDLTSIWGFDGDDVWVGSRDGELLHFDGSSWTPIDWPSLEDDSPCDRRSPVTQMWGADGILYFVTASQFARWDGSRVEVLGHWPGSLVEGRWCSGGIIPFAIWGNSPTEVFVGVADLSGYSPEESPDAPWRPARVCGGRVAVLRWDGAAFHRF